MTEIEELKKEVQELKHRLVMVADDVKAFVNFLDKNRMMESLEVPCEHSDSAWSYILNMEVACDLTSDECLSWKLYSESLPMMLRDDDKKKNFDEIVEMIQDDEFDGETTEYLLDKVGMSEQMLRQLVLRFGREQVESILDEVDNHSNVTTKISKDDVQFVCKELKMTPTTELVVYVMINYDNSVSNDPEGNYFYIVEDLIHNYLNKN